MSKKYIVLGILIFVVLLAGADFFLNRSEKSEEQVPTEIKQEEKSGVNFPSSVPAPNSTRIIAPEEFSGPIMHYNGEVFSPAVLNLSQNKDKSGCLVKVINDTERELVIRLGPYVPGKIKGFPYTPVSPHSAGIFDLRYNVEGDLEFYNLNNPSVSFLIRQGLSCR